MKKSFEYFNNELFNLREKGKEFSQTYPSLAPMLSGTSSDPDVERLIESTAYLTAILKEKLDDDLPEVINELAGVLFPHYLKDIPSSTIVQFTPKALLKESISIKKNSTLASKPVEETRCSYTTTRELVIHPLKLTRASLEESPGKPTQIRVSFQLNGTRLADFSIDRLRLYLSGEYNQSTTLYYLLLKKIHAIVLKNPHEENSDLRLLSENVVPVGLNSKDPLIPTPSNVFPGYGTLQDYFHFPDKFLFIDILGFDRWTSRGQGSEFDILFILKKESKPQFKITREHFSTFCVPAINIFEHEADPIRLDHKKSDYLVSPSTRISSHYHVYSVISVTGFIRGTADRIYYEPFQMFSDYNKGENNNSYQIKQKKSPLGSSVDSFISLAYPQESTTEISTLSLEILCTNGHLADRLNKDQITESTGSTPEYVSFTNISTPTGCIDSPIGDNMLWKFLSHLSLNYVSLATTENFQRILHLYNLESVKDRSAFLANKKRIDGISWIKTSPSDRLVRGVLMRGKKIEMGIIGENFSGTGDMFLFCSVLDYFLGIYSSLNSFTHFIALDISSGEKIEWPARIGEKELI